MLEREQTLQATVGWIAEKVPARGDGIFVQGRSVCLSVWHLGPKPIDMDAR